jgi:CRISPR/Cas system-associated endonuclease Cas1
MIQRPFRSVLVCFSGIIVAVTTLGLSHWLGVRQSSRALLLFSRRGLTVVAIDGKESPNGRLASQSKEAYAGQSEQSPRNINTTHRFRVKRSHLFKEKMSKFASRYRTDQTNNSQNMENYLSGAKRIVGGTFLQVLPRH